MGKTESTGGESVLFLLSLTLQAELWSFERPNPSVIVGGLTGDNLGGRLLDGDGLVVSDDL